MKNTGTQKKVVSIKNMKASQAFPLLRYFTIISFVSIVASSLFLGVSARSILVDNMIESEERGNVLLAQLLGKSVWSRFNSFISNSKNLTEDEIRSNPQVRILKEYLSSQVRELNIVKIKVFDLDGLTVFSSDFKQIGKLKHKHPLFLKAKNGHVVSKLLFRDKFYAREEFIENRNIISSYVPVWQGEKDNVVAVFEVYKDVTDIIGKINSLQTKIFAIIFSTSTILFLILFFAIRRTDDIINKYNSAQEEITEKIRDVAFYDHLTGLPNRVLFADRLEHAIDVAIRSEKLIALMFIDLDRFKQVNDNLGHEAGDSLLRQVSARFSDMVRPSDTVSRMSGDEFTIILENLSSIEFTTIVAQRIQRKMESPILIGENKVFVTCSIGISIYPFTDDDVQSLIKKADAAMFFSKSCGRNAFNYYSPEMSEHGSQRYEFEAELNTALEKSQFFLVFQPKIDLTNWIMQGMETLVYWRHPTKGIIEPDEFMPLLEETGLIIHVGEWMLRESCRLVKKWQDEGLTPIRISMNISAVQFGHPDFIEMVSSILKTANLDAKYLELVLSERRLIDDEDNNIDVMQKLKNKGIHLTIGDFGTGFSSLSYLSKLPIETLKMDKYFLQDIMTDSKKRSITTAIISFAHSLKLNIIADGIETREQLIFINAMRCTLAQGDLISGYLEEDEFYEKYKSGGSFSYLLKE